MEWYRNDKAAVTEALRRGERPDLATTMASGPLDELVALHQDLGIFAILDELEVQRVRAGVPDELLLRTLATLPFVEQASLSGGSEVLFREPAMLKEDARIITACGCCNEAMTIEIQNGSLVETAGLVHFAIPPKDWWKDIVFA